LAYLPDDPIQLSQLSTFRRRLRDEEEPSERHVQLRLDFEAYSIT
jgi:hypothetical protein